MANSPVINVGSILEMKKEHPCGSKSFKVLRIGSDIKIACSGCGRTLTIERVKLEKMIKKIISVGKEGENG